MSEPIGWFHVSDFHFRATGDPLSQTVAVNALIEDVQHRLGGRTPPSFVAVTPERGVLGSEYFRFDELPRNLGLLLAHRNELVPIITHRFPVGELAAAFDLFMSGRTGKVVVEQ